MVHNKVVLIKNPWQSIKTANSTAGKFTEKIVIYVVVL